MNILGAAKIKEAARSKSEFYLIIKLQIHLGESNLTRTYLKGVLFSLFNKKRKVRRWGRNVA